MSDDTNAGIRRRQLLEAAGAAAAAAATMGLARTAQAASPAPPTFMPMKMTMEFQLPQPRYPIPLSPSITVAINTAQGTDPEMGAYSYIEHVLAHMDVQGNPLSITDGIAAMTMANGDAFFFAWSGRYVPPTAPYDVAGEGTWTITGGAGRFLGAIGSGTTTFVRDPTRKVTICTMEGTVSAPR